jgi:hypothetical protein
MRNDKVVAPDSPRSRWLGASCAFLTAVLTMSTLALIGETRIPIYVIVFSAALIANGLPFLAEGLRVSNTVLKWLSKLLIATGMCGLLRSYFAFR